MQFLPLAGRSFLGLNLQIGLILHFIVDMGFVRDLNVFRARMHASDPRVLS